VNYDLGTVGNRDYEVDSLTRGQQRERFYYAEGFPFPVTR
jgi:hypothetical protein